MGYQTGRNILVNVKPEASYGVLPDNTGGKSFRANSGSVALSKEPIRSGENRRDGQQTRGRHGSKSVSGSYTADLSLGSFDDLFAAVFRGTWDTPLALSGLSVTADATAKTFTRSAGSWISDGVRVGDVVRFSGFTTTANNARNFRVVGLTATVMTVAETPVSVGSAQTGVGLARPKKLLQGVTPRSFAVEEAEIDIDGSELFTGVRVGQMQLNLQPNGMATVTFSLVGQDMQVKEGAESPYFASATTTVSLGMTAVEAVIRLGDRDVLDISQATLSINLNAAGFPVVGSNVTPDVFTNLATVEGTLTALRNDVSRVKNFLNEDQMSLHLLFTENESEPRDFIAFYVPNLTLSNATKSELGSDGPRTQQLSMMIGTDDRGGAFDPVMVKMQTSAA
ncbi:phage tail tube protein [Aureimonas sp. N4]|uniref:phage tail tube protein n=1 Tax=Aureimonas sp. N4 TaxID=1638165 RepID=UPI000784F57D|nr:phage tail tube protein [Aureimonas sp. N4]